MEKHVTFQSHGMKIDAVVNVPKAKNPPAIVMIHGFRVDKDENFKHFAIAAKRFEEAGFCVLRFDCRGSGKSEGKQEDMTVSSEVEDTLAAVDFLKKQPIDKNRIGILGKSLGGQVALVASLEIKPKALVLWAPVTDSDHYRKSFSKEEVEGLTNNGSILSISPTSGRTFRIGKLFYETILKINIEEKAKQMTFPTLIIHGDADNRVPLQESKDTYKIMKCKKDLHIVKGMDHTFQGHIKEVVEISLAWFKKNM